MKKALPWVLGIVVLILIAVIARSCRTEEPATEGAQSAADVPAAVGSTPGDGTAAGAVVKKPDPMVIEVMSDSGVKLRIEKRPRIDIPSPPYAARMKELQAGSDGGDPVARYEMGLLLYECRDVPTDEAGLAKDIEEIHQTRKHDGWDVVDPVQEEKLLRIQYKNCDGVPAEARTRFRDLLRSSADMGLLEAQLDLMFHLPKAEYCQFIEDCTPQQAAFMSQLREEARANVYKALDAGSAEALRTVGGWELNEEMGTPDEVEAYAYFSAYDQIQKAAGRERELTVMLSGLKKRMRGVDLDRAAAKTKELLSNPKCCLLTK